MVLGSLDETQRYPIYAIPDSGADRSCFPKEWAAPLGIKLAECTKYPVHTGNGKTNHYEWGDRLKATIAGHEIELAACFGNIKVGILGRDDFFNEFLVRFDHRKRITIIRAYGHPASN